MRKMATIRQIDALNPIEGADAIECATIGGWKVVVKKGEFRVLDKEDSIDKLNKIQEVLKIVPRMDRTSNSLFIASYTHFITVLGQKYNHDKFLAYLNLHKSEFVGVTQDPEQIQSLLQLEQQDKMETLQ
jgi:hypothetical protein